MSTPYVSSMINKYGDSERVKDDVRTLLEIIGRQSDTLLLDVIAEHSGNVANLYRLTRMERETLIRTAVDALRSAMEERL